LITQEQVTTTAIATSVGLCSHDTLVRALRSLGWGLSVGACLGVRLAQAVGGEGYLILDDVLIPKPFAKLIAFCAWDHDHSQHRHVFGQRLVFIVWSNGTLIIPLLFAFWQKDPTRQRRKRRRRKAKRQRSQAGTPVRRSRRRRVRKPKVARLASGVKVRSKNQLARRLVWKLARRGLRVDYILFDNWYASRANFNLFGRLRLHWVTRAKSNLKVEVDAQTVTVKQVGATVKKANYHFVSDDAQKR
jgi:hypothetical protein